MRFSQLVVTNAAKGLDAVNHSMVSLPRRCLWTGRSSLQGWTGACLYQYETVVDFETVNSVEGYGGSIDSHSIAAGSGMVFVGSGYGSFSQVPGNVLLAFKPSE